MIPSIKEPVPWAWPNTPGNRERSKAQGGLFIDEIGELHPIQMNKLLKVWRTEGHFESAYYSSEDVNTRAISMIFFKMVFQLIFA